MAKLKVRGKGLFIESFRTPAEKKRAEQDEKVEELVRENQELKERLQRLEEVLLKKEGTE